MFYDRDLGNSSYIRRPSLRRPAPYSPTCTPIKVIPITSQPPHPSSMGDLGRYELISHTADVTIRLHATEEEGLFGLFVAGADALRELLFEKERSYDNTHGNDARAEAVKSMTTQPSFQTLSIDHDSPFLLADHFSISAPDPELLLVDWLSALLRHMTVYRRAYQTFDAELFTPTRLCVVATYTDEIPTREIKGITMHNLHITFDGTAWHAEVTVDI